MKDPEVIEKFGLSSEIVKIEYFWYHGFYTSETKDKIRQAIRDHDYSTFMEVYNKNNRGLPNTAESFNARSALVGEVDITKEENFVKITNEDSEAG